MTNDEARNIPAGTILKYSYNTPWDGAICELIENKFPNFMVKIIAPGRNGSSFWSHGRIIETLPINRFLVYKGIVPNYSDNPVIRKIQSLDERFKAKSLRKVKVEKLPLGA